MRRELLLAPDVAILVIDENDLLRLWLPHDTPVSFAAGRITRWS